MEQDLFGFSLPARRSSRRGSRPRRNLTLEVAALALHAARLELESYSRPKSPHLYTQPQLLAVLVLKAYLRQTYRGVVELLELSSDLRDELGLGGVPNYSTLKKFADRIGPRMIDRVVGHVLKWCQGDGGDGAGLRVDEELAADSTGVECSPASRHYEMRIGRERGRYVKLSLVVTCTTLLLVTFATTFGPSQDRAEVMDLLWRASGRCQPSRLYADAGYDLEATHAFCRHGWGVRSYIPPVARGGFGVVKSPWRAKMMRLPACYGHRWNIETFISGFKRSTSSTLRARTDNAMLTEASLNLLAYAIRRA
jgi:hypothetical protein